MADAVGLFHFLRPLWLVALPVVAVVWWVVRRSMVSVPSWQKHIAPHLVEALMVNRQSARHFHAVDLSAIIIFCAAIAAAGPTWSRVPNPFFTETAPLVVALNLGESMLANDLQPTRLERAKLKILDLISLRAGARTALIAFAGSAHMVLPLTEDPELLKPFLEALAPDIMPATGRNTVAALTLSDQILATDPTPGSILFVTDGVDGADMPGFDSYRTSENPRPLVALVVGTEQGGMVRRDDGSIVGSPGEVAVNRQQLDRWRKAGDVSLINMSVGDSDIERIERIVASNLRHAMGEDEQSLWDDKAWWLVWPALLLTMVSFRKGWTEAW